MSRLRLLGYVVLASAAVLYLAAYHLLRLPVQGVVLICPDCADELRGQQNLRRQTDVRHGARPSRPAAEEPDVPPHPRGAPAPASE